MTNSPALASEQCSIPHHTGELAWLHLGNSRDSLRHQSQVYRNINFSTRTRGKLHAHHIVWRREVIPRNLLKRQATLSHPPPEEPSLSNQYVRGTLNLPPHVQWIPRFPDSKASRVCLQCLECRIVFLITRYIAV